jgi:hypothetical protein
MLAAMRVLAGATAAIATLGALTALPAVASPRVHVVSDCVHSHVRPESIVLACGDGTSSLGALRWRSWGGSSARATGTLSYVDCTPSCAEGTEHHARASLRLTTRRHCKGHGGLYYTRGRLTARGETRTVVLGCPAH